MKKGVATIPLDYGRCPLWLFERMKRLARAISIVIVEELGPLGFFEKLSHPVWFQSLGCILGFDWNSSGLTTTTLAALKEGLKGLEKELGIFVCGGKGKTSRKTPQQIKDWAEQIALSFKDTNKLIYTSRLTAKIDSSLIQDGFQIYHHNFIFTPDGDYVVIQQGMNTKYQKARRYHWQGNIKKKKDLGEEAHKGIISDLILKPLNLTAKKSKTNKEISLFLVEEPKTFLKDLRLLTEKNLFSPLSLKLENREFSWHPVVQERFDLKRLEKIVLKAHFLRPKTFIDLLSLEGVGPKTIRALSLVAELIYGAKPSYEDPARYSFAHGGKDGTPYFPKKEEIDKTIEILERGIKKAKLSLKEKDRAQKRLAKILIEN